MTNKQYMTEKQKTASSILSTSLSCLLYTALQVPARNTEAFAKDRRVTMSHWLKSRSALQTMELISDVLQQGFSKSFALTLDFSCIMQDLTGYGYFDKDKALVRESHKWLGCAVVCTAVLSEPKLTVTQIFKAETSS